MITIAVGLGLILNFLFFELLNLSAGGMVVPGFLALEMHHPSRLLFTIALSIATYLIVKLLSNFMLIYGRRHLILAIIIGFLLSEILYKLPILFNLNYQFQIIGFILPGLIAFWMDRQGVIRTLCSMIIAAAMIHLILIILKGGQFAI